MLQPATRNKLSYRTQRNNGGIGRMVLISAVLHVVVFFILGGYMVPKFQQVSKPVYYVDLLHKPVAKPRAGRPDTPPVPKKKTPSKRRAKKTSAVAKVSRPPKAVIKKVVKLPSLSKKTPTVSKIRAQQAPHITPVKTTDPMAAIEKMRRKRRIAALKNELNSLAHDQSPVSYAPVGIVGGSGTQAGVDYASWIKAYLSAAWALPANYLHRGLVGKMLLRFNRSGRLIYSELLAGSGDSFFDASIKRAVQQLHQLPSEPGHQLELTITFDPKDLLSR